ncbi:MAG TPA: glycosyltransferase family 4 protein [Solirubrobacteraceae bacterium]|jgi:glycosyltransferase involved in cell wall biosynthesis|nr:glycosyltransferase family 4 protein [Solirubrobacteraceae bacterium]
MPARPQALLMAPGPRGEVMRARLQRLLGRRSRVLAPAQPGEAMLELQRRGPAPLRGHPGATSEHFSVAAVIPSFRRGSGGHGTIARLLRTLARRGHEVSVWLEDNEGRHAREDPELTKRSFREFFGAGELVLETDFARWPGADVVLATGWQTVARTLLLEDCAARAYLVQDHEPEFYGTSAESLWAADSYRAGLHCIAASPWLAGLLRERYGASATHFDLAPDHALYREQGTPREDLVVFYARSATPRRAVPLGLLALAELARRRPGTRIALFGEAGRVAAPFAHEDLGVLEPAALARLYGRAQVGMVLSMTNPSLVNLEMMACGLPCVELASDAMSASFGESGAPALAAASATALCEAIERLLDDDDARGRARAKGLSVTAARSWESAAEQVEQGLRTAFAHARGASAEPERARGAAQRGGPG